MADFATCLNAWKKTKRNKFVPNISRIEPFKVCDVKQEQFFIRQTYSVCGSENGLFQFA